MKHSDLVSFADSSVNLNREFAVHQETKVEATETSWIHLLREYLPNRYAIERAMVFDIRNPQDAFAAHVR